MIEFGVGAIAGILLMGFLAVMTTIICLFKE